MGQRTSLEHGFFLLLIAGVTLFEKLPMLFYTVELAAVVFLVVMFRGYSIRLNWILLAALLFVTYLTVNFVSMLRYEHTVWDFLTVASQYCLATGLIVFVSQFRRIEPRVLLRTWALAGLLIAGVTIQEYVGYLLGQEAMYYVGPLPRAIAVFGEPSNLGHFLVPPVVILLVSSLRREPLFASRTRQLGSLVVITIAMLLSLSQGAITTFLIVLAAVVAVHFSNIEQLTKITGGIGISIGGLALIPGVPIVRSYIVRFAFVVAFFTGGSRPESELAYSSVGTRLANGVVNLKIWADHLLFGVGANQIGHHYMNYESAIPGRVQDIYGVPWTGYLADFGLVGFCLIVAVWVFAFRTLIRAWNTPAEPIWAPTLFFVLFSRVISQFLTGSVVDPMVWLTIAAVVACGYGQGDTVSLDGASETTDEVTEQLPS